MNIYLFKKNNFWILDFFLLALFTGSLFFIYLGSRPLTVPDEGNYAEIIREMAASRNWITPYLNEIKFFEKPILLYWLGTIAIKIGGVSIWSLRSVNAVLALFLCLFTYFTGRKIYNRKTGILSALILSTTLLFFIFAQNITTDMPVAVFTTITLWCFLLGVHAQNRARFLYLTLAAASSGFAVLSKGLIGIILPAMIILFWMIWVKEYKLLKKVYFTWCIFIFLSIALPWHLIVTLKNPEFLYIYFFKHHLLRFATKTVGHPEPFWFYLPVLCMGFFPWIVFLPKTIQYARSKNDNFLLIWAMVILIFFTIATSKLTSYILPAIPPLALLTAKYISHQLDKPSHEELKFEFTLIFIFMCILALTLDFLPEYWPIPNKEISIYHLWAVSGILFTGSFISLIFAKKNLYTQALISTFLTVSLTLVILKNAMIYLDTQSIKTLSHFLKPLLKPNDKVVVYHHYFQDLPFYLQEKIYVVESRKLFRNGMNYQNAHDWLMDENNFKKLWESHQRVYAMMRMQDFNTFTSRYANVKYHILGKTLSSVLVINE